MPPKVRVSREEILITAVELVRTKGEGAVNARAIAAALSCSTQPIFSNFSTMDTLLEAVRHAAYERYLAFLQREAEGGRYPPYKAFGMAYIRFAAEERELFRLLFMCDRQGEALAPTTDFAASVDMIVRAVGVSRTTAERMHMEMWTCVHGIATMLVTSFLTLSWEQISDMLSDIYQGLRLRHTTKEATV